MKLSEWLLNEYGDDNCSGNYIESVDQVLGKVREYESYYEALEHREERWKKLDREYQGIIADYEDIVMSHSIISSRPKTKDLELIKSLREELGIND